MTTIDDGRSPGGSGSRPTGRASEAVSSVPASIPNALDFDIAFAAAAHPEKDVSLEWILLGVNRRAEAFVMDADSGFFDVDLLPEFWAEDNGIDYPPLAVGMYLMTDIVITPDSYGDPTFKGKFKAIATLASAIEARRAETGTGSVEDESAVPKADAQPSSETPNDPS